MSQPILLTAKPVTESLYNKYSAEVESFRNKYGRPPTLATVLVGKDPASQVYVGKKGEMCKKLGMGHVDFTLPESSSESELLKIVTQLNLDPSVDGILVQKPLPKQIRENIIFDTILPEKDVDCFSPTNVGLLSQGRGFALPCTPAGILEILSHYNLPVAGQNVVVIGRSDIVGKPVGLLLLNKSATVTYTHSKTRNLSEHIENADIVVAAIGRSKFLSNDLPWKKSAVVIDVGINRDSNGKLCGDVDFDKVSPLVHAITPVPGGVGPMTIALLMKNTIECAKKRMEPKS